MWADLYYGGLFFFNENPFAFTCIAFLFIVLLLTIFTYTSNGWVFLVVFLAVSPFAHLSVSWLSTTMAYNFNSEQGIYSVEFLTDQVASGSMTEEQARKFLPAVASYNRELSERKLQEKTKEGEKRYDQTETKIKTKEIQQRLEKELQSYASNSY